MAKITSKSMLNVGVELTINTTAKTFTLVEAGNLVYKDGVTLQALYSKFVQLWTQPEYNEFPFPMYAIDAKSGQFQFGTDGQTFSGWKPADDATRQALRDGGWSEYSNAGVLNRQYVGIVSLGEVNTGAQLYYQRASTDAPTNFTFTDEVNEGVQVYGDATNGNFDKRTYFKAFVREYGKKYKSSTLADTGQTATGAYTVNVLLSNEDDLKIQANDATVAANTPYTGITVTYYGSNQNKTIGAGSYPFTKVIDGNNATLEQIYTKIQYLLRQNSDIDAGAGSVTGKTADELCYFVGDTLYTTTGVFVENIQAADLNRIIFVDQNGVQRYYPYSSAGTLNSNAVLTAGGTGYYRMYFADTPTGDYGSADAITVNDKDGLPIAGTISSGTISFTFDYDGNVQGGRTAGTDASVVVVAGNNGSAKPVVATGTITRSKGISISLVAEQDRAFIYRITMHKFQFDGAQKRIYIDPAAVTGSVVTFTPQELWTEWVEWVSMGDNSKYLPAFESVMIPLDANTMLGQYLFIRNDLGWRGVPPIADQVTIVINGSFYAKDAGLPVMENRVGQETALVINRSTLTSTAMVNSGGVDLAEVLTKLNQMEATMASKADVYAASLLG